MLLVGSENAGVGFADGMRILRRGGRAMAAVEATIRQVEANLADHSVGLGGLPNIVGEVELDASVMDGRTLEAGAVCAVRGYPHVISLAREVMARLPHVLVAGAGAERLARELGMRRRTLLTRTARATYARKVTRRLGRRGRLIDRVRAATRDPEIAASSKDYFGTVNVIAIDRRGDLASGVSTSGWAWKYPGRVGDSPLIGAGNYCRQPVRRLRLHRLRRDGHPELHRPLARPLHEDGTLARPGGARGDDGPAPPHRPLPAPHEPGRGQPPRRPRGLHHGDHRRGSVRVPDRPDGRPRGAPAPGRPARVTPPPALSGRPARSTTAARLASSAVPGADLKGERGPSYAAPRSPHEDAGYGFGATGLSGWTPRGGMGRATLPHTTSANAS